MTLASTANPSPLTSPVSHARLNHRFEQLPKDITVTEAAVAIDRERRVMGHLVVETEAAEPTIDPAQEMARRNALFEVEQVEWLALIARMPSHHHRITRADSHSTESPFALDREGFSTSSTHTGSRARWRNRKQ
jgi:hypothetical protein